MNNFNQNSNQTANNLQNEYNSMSALDALNQKLLSENVSNSPSNAKQIKESKNVKNNNSQKSNKINTKVKNTTNSKKIINTKKTINNKIINKTNKTLLKKK